MRIITEIFEIRADDSTVEIRVGSASFALPCRDAALLADSLRLALSERGYSSVDSAGAGFAVGEASAAGEAYAGDETGFASDLDGPSAPESAQRATHDTPTSTTGRPRRRRTIIGATRRRRLEPVVVEEDADGAAPDTDEGAAEPTPPRGPRSIIVGRKTRSRSDEGGARRLWEELRDFLAEQGEPVPIERILQWAEESQVLDVRHPERVIRMTLSKHPSVFHQVDGDWTASA